MSLASSIMTFDLEDRGEPYAYRYRIQSRQADFIMPYAPVSACPYWNWLQANVGKDREDFSVVREDMILFARYADAAAFKLRWNGVNPIEDQPFRTKASYIDRIVDRVEAEADLFAKTLYLALDCSGSGTPIDAEILREVTRRALTEMEVSRVVLMSFDMRVLHQVAVTSPSQLDLVHGRDALNALQVCGGGTDPGCVLEAVSTYTDTKPGIWRRAFIITDGMFSPTAFAAQMRLEVQPVLLVVPGGQHVRGVNCHDI